MLKRLTLIILAAVFLSSMCHASELEDRRQIDALVESAFAKGDFAKLEHLGHDFLVDRARTSSGLWKLTLFHFSLANLADSHIRSEVYWTLLNQRVDAWRKAYPASAAALIAKANVIEKQGWMLRGHGYANSVPAAAWPKFYSAITEAKELLESGKAYGQKDPHWWVSYVQLLTYLPGSHDDEIMKAFESGIDAFPGYYQLYFSVVFHLLPKWHGDAEALERFADHSVERSRSTEGEGMYARIYWVAFQSQYYDDLFQQSAVSWTKMKKGIAAVLAAYPDAWNLNNFAYFACLAGDREEARVLLNRMGDEEPLMNVWQLPEKYESCRQWAVGDGHPAGII